jgi:hypothetical protein
MHHVDIAALIVSLLALGVAGVAAAYTKSQAHWTRVGAEAALVANHLASAPAVEIRCDGESVRGLEMYARSSADLDSIVVEVLFEPTGISSRQSDTAEVSSLYMDSLGFRADGVGTRSLTIHDVRAGQDYWITGTIPNHFVDRAVASLRLTACLGGETWVSEQRIGPIQLVRD